MARVALTSGFYRTKSIIAGAQRCLNLYPERNAQDAPYPFTHYQTPGLNVLAAGPSAPVRGEYTASDGILWVVIGNGVYWVDSAFNLHGVGSIGTAAGPVTMKDNRLVLILVDGTPNLGWAIDAFATKAMVRFNGAGNFLGANIVDLLDTFFLFNKPNSNVWYISLAEINYANLQGGPAATGTISAAGTGYPNGIFSGIAATGGSGDSVTLDLTVAGGIVTQAVVGTGGENYKVGDVLGIAASDLGGEPATGTIAGGTLYTSGTYTGVALTGGSGTGVLATIVVSGGEVTTVTVTAGSGSLVGDVLSAPSSALGGTGSGFTYTVLTITPSGSGFTFTLATVGSSAFDPLDFVAMTGANNGIGGFKVVNRQIWIIGDNDYGEIWYNLGSADFTFARTPSIAIQHGCAAIFSVAQWDLLLFWLGRDSAGDQQVYMGDAYQARIISPPAVSAAISGYTQVSDAIGYVYQQNGHVFYVLTFPGADATWVYDVPEQLWHERAWFDAIGNEHRHRSNCQAFAYGKVVVGDWENGQLYSMDPKAYTDVGRRIGRRRGFPHIVDDSNRIVVSRFIADMDVGESDLTTTDQPIRISLRASITKGASWGNPRSQSLGSTGQYLTNAQFRQLGMGRDWVFELFWDFPADTSLNGAWIEAEPCGS